MAKPASRPEWSYGNVTMAYDDPIWVKEMKEWGEQGWEAYAVIMMGNYITHYFKRRKT